MSNRRYLLPKDGQFYKTNLHCHSVFSDGMFTPAKLKEVYMAQGYSAIAFSDHSVYHYHKELTDENFVALASCEIETSEPNSTEGGFDRVKTYHLNIFDTNPEYMAEEKKQLIQPNDWYYSIDELNDYLEKITKMGFLVCYNHPYWSLQNYDDYKDLKHLWALEIFNFGCEQGGNYGYAPQVYDELLRLHPKKNLFCTASDDNHNWTSLDDPESDSFGGFTMIKAPTLTYAQLITALKKGDFYASMGPKIYEFYIEDNKVFVKTSPVKKITLVTGGRACYVKIAPEGETLTHAVFELRGKEGYIRLDCIDTSGKHANSNAYIIQEIQTYQISSLEKVFPESNFIKNQVNSGTALRGEKFSYQVAVKLAGEDTDTALAKISINSPLEKYCTIYREEMIPAHFTAYADSHDEGYITTKAGLFPDALYPIPIKNGIFSEESILSHHAYKTFWIEVAIPIDIKSGRYDIALTFETAEPFMKNTAVFSLNILEATLEKDDFKYTQWLHLDCLADYYKDPIFSENHWRRIEQFIQCASTHGINTLLTPLFTPSLDVYNGHDRKIVQLVDVVKKGDEYSFSFERFHKFVQLAKKYDIQYLEISHFFSQWGAKYAPKIIATEDNKTVSLFGWHTLAESPEYITFLDLFLPAFIAELEKTDYQNKIFFHISDEPNETNIENYTKAQGVLKKHIKNASIIDALSDYRFAQQKLVDIPVVAIDHLSPFLKNEVKPLWTYYCCAQSKNVSNRFFALPSWRNRIIGTQLYKYDIQGFLHWGYNFYYSQYSRKLINPFCVPDADAAFPAGDPFSVYPHQDGPIPSIRLKVFYEALQDRWFLNQMEKKIGKQKVLEIVEELLSMPVDFCNLPKGHHFFTKLRNKFVQKGVV